MFAILGFTHLVTCFSFYTPRLKHVIQDYNSSSVAIGQSDLICFFKWFGHSWTLSPSNFTDCFEVGPVVGVSSTLTHCLLAGNHVVSVQYNVDCGFQFTTGVTEMNGWTNEHEILEYSRTVILFTIKIFLKILRLIEWKVMETTDVSLQLFVQKRYQRSRYFATREDTKVGTICLLMETIQRLQEISNIYKFITLNGISVN